MPEQFMEFVQANLPLVIAGAVILLLLLLWAFLASRRTKVNTDTSDVLDEGHGPAGRNQALIDAPAAAAQDLAPKVEDAAPAAGGDDLTRIKGVGPKLQTMLNTLGVTSFADVAAWTESDIDRIDSQLGKFEGRIRRDNWSAQAEMLLSGDTAAYEDKFGKL